MPSHSPRSNTQRPVFNNCWWVFKNGHHSITCPCLKPSRSFIFTVNSKPTQGPPSLSLHFSTDSARPALHHLQGWGQPSQAMLRHRYTHLQKRLPLNPAPPHGENRSTERQVRVAAILAPSPPSRGLCSWHRTLPLALDFTCMGHRVKYLRTNGLGRKAAETGCSRPGL